jgi:hypothetical protein
MWARGGENRMNVTRGLFRLWVVAAVLWTVGMGGSTWWTYPEPDVVAEAGPETWPRRPVNAAPPFDPTKPVEKVTDPALLAKLNATSAPRDDGNWFDATGHRVVSKEEFREAQTKYRREALSSAVFLGIMPPIAVLIIGASLAWAVRGFKA